MDQTSTAPETAAAVAPTSDGFVTVEWVCQGWFVGRTNKMFVRLSPTDDLDRRFHYDKNRNTAKLRAGAVYAIEAIPDGSSARIADARFVRMFPDAQQVLAWQTATRAAQDTDAAERILKRETDLSARLRRELLPLRRARAQMSFTDRTAFDVLVLQTLQSRLTPEEERDD